MRAADWAEIGERGRAEDGWAEFGMGGLSRGSFFASVSQNAAFRLL